MKRIIPFLVLALLFTACQPTANDAVQSTASESSFTDSSNENSKKADVVVISKEEIPAESDAVLTNEEAPEVSETQMETMDLAVYYLKDDGTQVTQVREVHRVQKTDTPAMAALIELLTGNIQTKDAFRPLPEHATIRGINIKDGKAVIDFDANVLEMSIGAEGEVMAIQAIANTLTEFPSIQTVEFWVEGSKEKANDWWGHVGLDGIRLERNLSEVWEPAIWIDHPAEGQVIEQGRIRLAGSAIAFESTVGYRLEDANGTLLADGFLTAGQHQGMRGFFDITFNFETPGTEEGVIKVFGESGMDGSPTDMVELPVRFQP